MIIKLNGVKICFIKAVFFKHSISNLLATCAKGVATIAKLCKI